MFFIWIPQQPGKIGNRGLSSKSPFRRILPEPECNLPERTRIATVSETWTNDTHLKNICNWTYDAHLNDEINKYYIYIYIYMCVWLFISVCLNWRPVPLPVFLMQCLRLRGIVQPGLVQHEDKPTQRAPPPASRFFARVPQWGGVSLASHIASGSNTRPMSLPFPHVRNVMFLALQDLGPHPKAAPAKLHWRSWVTCNHDHSKYDTSVSP